MIQKKHKIIHFSDSHAGGPAEDWMAYIDKRWVGVFNYKFRRRFKHDQSLLYKAVEYILKEKPDIAICSGDITSTGQPGEFQIALKALAPLVESDIPFIYIPGNHDCYVKRKSCVEAMKDAMRYLNRGKLEFDELPTVVNQDWCDIIVVNESFPTNLLMSWGYMKKPSREFIKKICAEPTDKPRILLGHFPLIEDHPMLRFRHRMWFQNEIVELLKNGKIDVSLCGHVHAPYTELDSRGRGEICAGSVTRNACMAEVEYNPGDDIFTYRKITLS